MAIAKVCNVDERSNAHPRAIQFASRAAPGIWIWHVQVDGPGPPFGSLQGEARSGEAGEGVRCDEPAAN